jgi:hypothetical protein
MIQQRPSARPRDVVPPEIWRAKVLMLSLSANA